MQLIARWFLLSVFLSQVALAAPVAQIGLLQGSVFITKATGKRVFVAEGSNVEAGDLVVTGNDSTAMLAFTDGSKVALRPNSIFQVMEYQYNKEQPAEDNALFQLVKGGLRTVTGLIGKRGNQNAYRLGTATATIGIRGTEYVARVCDGDCSGSTAKPTDSMLKLNPVAKVVLLKGTAKRSGESTHQEEKVLAKDDVLYQGDRVNTVGGGVVGLLFTDGGRIVIPAGTVFSLESYQYSAEQPEKNNMLIRLLKGSARVVTGLIGKRNPQSVNFRTNTATIGIRGTDFDMACLASGSEQEGALKPDASASSANEGVDCDQAVVTSVREGAVEMENGQGKQRVDTAQSGYADSAGTAPKGLTGKVDLFDDDTPLPGTLDKDVGKAFGSTGTTVDKGLVVSVLDGKVLITSGTHELPLAPGQTGLSTSAGKEIFLLGAPPVTVGSDPFLKNVRFEAFSCGL